MGCAAVAGAWLAFIGWSAGSVQAQEATRGASPPEDAPEARFTLAGEVVDAFNEAPVVAAMVKFPELARLAYTNVGGRFSLTDFPAGTWEIVVEQLGYHTSDGTITVSEGNGLRIRLSPDPIALEGLRVQTRADRMLTRRRRFFPYRIKTVTAAEFEDAVNPNPFAVLKRMSGTAVYGCTRRNRAGFLQDHACTLRLAGPTPILMYLDDAPLLGGLPAFEGLDHRDIHSMDLLLYSRSAALYVYTKWFVNRVNRSKTYLMPYPW